MHWTQTIPHEDIVFTSRKGNKLLLANVKTRIATQVTLGHGAYPQTEHRSSSSNSSLTKPGENKAIIPIHHNQTDTVRTLLLPEKVSRTFCKLTYGIYLT